MENKEDKIIGSERVNLMDLKPGYTLYESELFVIDDEIYVNSKKEELDIRSPYEPGEPPSKLYKIIQSLPPDALIINCTHHEKLIILI